MEWLRSPGRYVSLRNSLNEEPQDSLHWEPDAAIWLRRASAAATTLLLHFMPMHAPCPPEVQCRYDSSEKYFSEE